MTEAARHHDHLAGLTTVQELLDARAGERNLAHLLLAEGGGHANLIAHSAVHLHHHLNFLRLRQRFINVRERLLEREALKPILLPQLVGDMRREG